MKNFYDIFQNERGKMLRTGQDVVHLMVPDKAPEHLMFDKVEVNDSLDRLKGEGHSIKAHRMDSNSEDGFFGYFFSVSTNVMVTTDES